MKLPSSSLGVIALCALCALFVSGPSHTANALRGAETIRTSQEEQSRSRSCPVSMCFGIDGGLLTRAQVRLQREFFGALLQSLSQRDDVKVAAVQFGSSNRRLFGLTSDLSEPRKIAAKLSFRGDNHTSVSSSIVYCDSVLREEEERSVRMVLFSAGRHDLGGSPGRRAAIYRERAGGDIIVISLTDSMPPMFHEITANNTRDIFTLDSDEYDGLLTKVTERVCRA